MNGELIHPNWHVVFLHFPIALLVAGVLIEILSFFGAKGSFRAAGRWMILLGALSAVPAALTGLYAFREQVAGGAISLHQPWHEVARTSPWTPEQWASMESHIWFNGIAVTLAILVVVLWVGASTRVRSALYWPSLLALVFACGLLVVGAWHGGEAVYRHAVAVEPPTQAGAEGALVPDPGAGGDEVLVAGGLTVQRLQLHLTLAGISVGIALAALALSIHTWGRGVKRVRDAIAPDTQEPGDTRTYEETQATPLTTHAPAPRRGFGPLLLPSPWPFWLAVVIFGAGTAFFGYWSFAGELTDEAFESNVEYLADPEGQRVLAHVIGGSLLIVLPILALILSPLLRRSRFLAGFFSIVLIAVVGFQAWFGILLLFDSHHGPLWQFQSAGAVEEGEPPRGDEAPQPPAEPERDQVPPLVRGEGGERGERLPARENRRELDRRDFDPRDDEPVGGGDGASRRENDARATGERRGGLEDEPRNGDGAAPNANGGESRADAATAEASVVRMTNGREFDPKVITIRVGETIRWENPSQDVHTVTADPALAIFPEDVLLPEGVEPFDSGEIKPGGTWERTFDVPGRYRYFCIPHEQAGMTGEIIVEETPASGAGSESAGEAEGAEQAEE